MKFPAFNDIVVEVSDKEKVRKPSRQQTSRLS